MARLGIRTTAAAMGAAVLLVISRVDIVEMLEHEIEWPTLIFFMMLFIVVGICLRMSSVALACRSRLSVV